MDTSKLSSKLSINYLNQETKVFVKLSSKGDCLTDKRILTIQNNNENIILQSENNIKEQYKYDYIFSEYDNIQSMSSYLIRPIKELITNDKNIVFLTLGENGLGSTRFLFGNPINGILNKDSFFYYAYQEIVRKMRAFCTYDNILIEIYKITNERFILDYREIIHDKKNTIIDDINAHIKAGHKNGMTSSSIVTNDILEGAGHVIIRLKFFKYIDGNDVNKSHQDIEILRSFTFIDIEGFNNELTNLIISKKMVTSKSDPKNYSLLCFKTFIESIADQDLAKFGELSSTLIDVLKEIFSIQSLFTFIFGFVDQYENSVLESRITLDILNKCKGINNNLFFSYLQELNISISQLGNGAVKEEFQILDMIFSELMFYIENTFLSNHDNKKEKLESLYQNIKDLDQRGKYQYLRTWLIKNDYDFNTNKEIHSIFDHITIYYKSRARWKCLIKARNEILQLTVYLKETTETIKDIKLSSIHKPIEGSYDYDNKTNTNINQSLTSNNSLGDFLPNISSYIDILNDITVISAGKDKDNNLQENKEAFWNNEIEPFKTTRRSIESSFLHNLFKDYHKNLKLMFNGIYNNFTMESGCMSCDAETRDVIPFNFAKRVNEYKNISVQQTGNNFDKSNFTKNNHNNNSYIISKSHNAQLSISNKPIVKINFEQNDNISKRVNKLNSKMNEMHKI